MLARRSVLRTLRQPAMVIPSLVFPMMLLAINSSGLDSATKLPGFPSDSYLAFALAIPFVQGALFAANSAGTNIAYDVESGFINRLSLTPLRRLALLGGQLAGILALGLIQAITFVPRGRGGRSRHRGRCRGRARDRRPVAGHLARVRLRSARSSRCAPGLARRCRACSR